MAREVRREPTHRFQIDPRNIHDYTIPSLQVTAEPTDPYAAPKASPGLRRLVESLQSVNEGLRVYSSVLQQQYQEDLEEGQLLYSTGQELPQEPRSQGIIHGYERLKGLNTANTEYRARVQEYFNEYAESASPEEFFVGLSELSREFLEGASESFVSSFAPQALRIEEDAFNRYVQHNIQRIQEQSVEMIHQIAYDTVRGQIGTLLGSLTEEEFEALKGNPDLPVLFQDMNGPEITKQALRDALTAVQEEGLRMGISRSEVSSIFLDAVGTLAVELALPEILEFAKEKDESGISLEGSSLGNRVRRYRENAELSRANQEAARERIEEQERQERIDSLLRRTHYDIGLMMLQNDKRAAALAARTYRQLMASEDSPFHELPPTVYRDIVNRLIQIEQGEFQFAESGQANEQLYFTLRTNAVFGNLNLEDVLDAVESGQLTLAQANTLMDMYVEQEEKKEQAQWAWADRDEVQRLTNVFANYIAGGNDLLGGPRNLEKYTAAVYAFEVQLEEFRKTNERNPTKGEWLQYIADPVLHRFQTSLDQILMYEDEVSTIDYSRLIPPEEEKRGLIERFVDKITGRNRDEEPSGRWSYKDPEIAYDVTLAMFRNNETWKKQDVINEYMRNGESQQAAEAYATLFAYMLASEWAVTDAYQNNPSQVSYNFVQDLMLLGYTQEEAFEALQAGREINRLNLRNQLERGMTD